MRYNRRTRQQIFFIAFIVFFTMKAGAVETPVWLEQYWFDLDTHWQVVFNGDVPGTFNFHESNCRHFVDEITVKTSSHGTQSSFSVYVLRHNGLIFGSGTVHLSNGPFPMDLTVRMPDTVVNGEVWIRTDDLAVVFWKTDFTGILEGSLGGEWEPVGDISLTYSQEFDPPLDLFHFPLAPLNTWSVSYSQYWFGRYLISVDLFTPPEEDEGTFDESWNRNLTLTASEYENINGYDSLRIVMMSTGAPEQNVWFADEPGWLSRLSMDGTDQTGNVYLTGWSVDLTDYGHDFATPEPTRTPEPPTPTPTPSPTHPTPTVTGTPPTPTPTYTLPPWIPPTPTPPPGTPTPTPTPPGDRPSIRIQTNQPVYQPGDAFLLTTTITNPLNAMFVSEFILLQIEGDVWFWPEWTQDIQSVFRILDAQTQYADEEILSFTWPDIPGSETPVYFWAFLTKPGTYDIVGEYGSCFFHYQ